MLLAARILTAPLFLYSGWGKVGDVAGVAGQIAAAGFPLSGMFAFGAIAVELGAGSALVLGLLTRPSAVALFVYTTLTGLLFHNFWAVAPAEADAQLTQFLKNAGVAGGLGLIAWLGGGHYALDQLFNRRP